MDSNRLDEWVRHYDNLLWTVTSILFAANGALLAYSSDKDNFVSDLAIGGLVLTGLTVYFAASMRELRHRVQGHLDGELPSIIQEGRRLYQWWAFIALFVMLTVGWTRLLLANEPAWWPRSLIFGGGVAITTLWLGWCFDRPAKKTKKKKEPSYILGLLVGIATLVLGFCFHRPAKKTKKKGDASQ